MKVINRISKLITHKLTHKLRGSGVDGLVRGGVGTYQAPVRGPGPSYPDRGPRRCNDFLFNRCLSRAPGTHQYNIDERVIKRRPPTMCSLTFKHRILARPMVQTPKVQTPMVQTRCAPAPARLTRLRKRCPAHGVPWECRS